MGQRLGRVLAAGGLAAGLAVAAHAAGGPGSSPVTGCARGSTVTVVAAGKSCPRGSTKLTWNVTGPRGAAGTKGAAGPAGAKGATAVFGANLGGANGLPCQKSGSGPAGTITVRYNAATGLEEFVCQ